MIRSASGAGTQETALVTGASSGIGRELAKIFAREGNNLVLVARTQNALTALAEELQKKYSIRAIVVPADLSDPSAPSQIHSVLNKETVRIDYLVNNAGFGTRRLFHESDLKSQLDMIQVNITALVHLTRLFLPSMVEKKQGGILNLASTAGFQAGPLMAVYYASKAFVLSFTQAIADELKDTGVKVTALSPGPTRTGFSTQARVENSRLFQQRPMDPVTVAEAGYQGLMNGKTIVVPGFKNKALVTASKIIPRKYVIRQVRKLNEDVIQPPAL